MELADLTRGMRKNDVLEPEKLFFAKPGLSEFHESSAEKKIELEKLFLQSPISSHKTIRGHATKKMNRKAEVQTSRISSNLRIWQSYSRVPSNS